MNKELSKNTPSAEATDDKLATLHDVVEIALKQANESGVSQSEAAASVSQGLSVTVRKGDIETVEHT